MAPTSSQSSIATCPIKSHLECSAAHCLAKYLFWKNIGKHLAATYKYETHMLTSSDFLYF